MKARRIQLGILSLVLFGVLIAVGVSAASTASANQPNPNLEYTLHVGSCNTAADYKGNCAVTAGSTFVASVSLDAIPGPFDATSVVVAYTGVTSKDNPDSVWPGCTLEAFLANETIAVSGCAIGIGAPSVNFTGTVFTASFNCVADGTLSLVHGPADTLIIDENGKTNTEPGPDVLNIDCAPPTITPTPTNTPTPTPGPIGGVAFDASSSGGSTMPLLAAAVALLSVVLGSGVWRVRTRRAS